MNNIFARRYEVYAMDIGETRRVVRVVPEPAPMTPIAPIEPTPEKVPA